METFADANGGRCIYGLLVICGHTALIRRMAFTFLLRSTDPGSHGNM